MWQDWLLFFLHFSFPTDVRGWWSGLTWTGLVWSWQRFIRHFSSRRPCLHAHAEGLQLVVEVLGGFWQNQAGVQAGVPDTAEAQRDLFDQVEQRVTLHAHRLVRIEFDALFRDGQDAKARASQSWDGHQIMGPYGVTFRGTERTDPLDRTFALNDWVFSV